MEAATKRKFDNRKTCKSRPNTTLKRSLRVVELRIYILIFYLARSLKKKLSELCYFKEEMDGGYSLFYSIEDREKYLGFNRNHGKPINYQMPEKIDKKCYKLFKRVAEDSSNGLSTSTAVDYEPTPPAYNNNLNNNVHNGHRHKSSTRQHPKTHSSKIETSKPRSTSASTSSKRNRLQQQPQPSPHPVRHHHNEQPLRHYHTISNKENKNIDSNDNLSSTKQLGNEDLNAIYNHNDSGVNIVSESKGKQHNRHLKKPTQSVSKLSKPGLDQQARGFSSHHRKHQTEPNPTNDSLGKEGNNNDTNNCSTKITEDETEDKLLRGSRKIAKGKNAAHANDKPNNKCNNINRRHRKNSRRPSPKSPSHKHQQASP